MGFVVLGEVKMGEWWMWTGFFSIVLVLLWIDIRFVGGGKAHKVSLKEAGIWSLIWVSVALLFNLAIWLWLDHSAGREIANQKGWSFSPATSSKGTGGGQRLRLADAVRLLRHPGGAAASGPALRSAGAIVMRAGMVFAGSWLIEQFHWILYLFGAFLLLTGAKMLWAADKEPDLENNALLGWMRRRFKVTETLEGRSSSSGVTVCATRPPLLLILVLVEVSDLIFAVDSIPAIFAVTTDPFIVLTSNIFAIMGLRAMYFLLAGVADRFALLKYGLALILMFIGVKMLLLDIFKIPTGIALGVVALILLASMGLSLLMTRKRRRERRSKRLPREPFFMSVICLALDLLGVGVAPDGVHVRQEGTVVLFQIGLFHLGITLASEQNHLVTGFDPLDVGDVHHGGVHGSLAHDGAFWPWIST